VRTVPIWEWSEDSLKTVPPPVGNGLDDFLLIFCTSGLPPPYSPPPSTLIGWEVPSWRSLTNE